MRHAVEARATAIVAAALGLLLALVAPAFAWSPPPEATLVGGGAHVVIWCTREVLTSADLVDVVFHGAPTPEGARLTFSDGVMQVICPPADRVCR